MKIFTVVCKMCGGTFKVMRVSSAGVPHTCKECRRSYCRVCGVEVSHGKKMCGKARCVEVYYRNLQQSSIVKLGYKKQGLKIRGKNNLMARREVRVKQARSTSIKNAIADDGSVYRSKMEALVANELMRSNIGFEYEPALEIDGRLVFPDFKIGNVIIEVMGWTWGQARIDLYKEKIRRYLEHTGYELCIVIDLGAMKDFSYLGRIPRLHLIPLREPNIRMLELKGITNVDYSHFLSEYDGKCAAVHSHSSFRVSVKVWGVMGDGGMVVDFGGLKKEVKDVVGMIDHKMVVGMEDVPAKRRRLQYGVDSIALRYTDDGGRVRKFSLPKEEVCVLDGVRSTVENMTMILGQKVLDRLPANVFGVEFGMSEGLDNYCASQVWRDCPWFGLEKLYDLVTYPKEV